MLITRKENEEFTVTLEIVENPEDKKIYHLACNPTVLHVMPGDTIIFKALQGRDKRPFTIVAKGLSPLDKVYIQSDGQSDGEEISSRVMDGSGSYTLACAVLSKDNIIYMDANCPPIIVDPGLKR